MRSLMQRFELAKRSFDGSSSIELDLPPKLVRMFYEYKGANYEEYGADVRAPNRPAAAWPAADGCVCVRRMTTMTSARSRSRWTTSLASLMRRVACSRRLYTTRR